MSGESLRPEAIGTPGDDALSPQRRSAVLRQAMSVGMATGAYGISFGALSSAAGLSVLQTQALSALLFSGGSQFAVVGILAAGGTGVAAVATSTLLGVRNGLYALENVKHLGVTGVRRVAAAQLTIDESTAVGLAQTEPRAQRLGFWATGLSVFVFWNLMTLLGALVGSALGDPKQWGLDAAAAGAFCALVAPRMGSTPARATAVIAVFLALVTAAHVPPGVPVLVATAGAVGVGLAQARTDRRSDGGSR